MLEDSSDEVSFHGITDIESGGDEQIGEQPPQNKLESRSLQMLKRLFSESFLDDDDEDLSEDNSTKTILSRPIEKKKYVDKTVNWSQWEEVRSKIIRWSIIAAASLVISVFCILVLGNGFIYYGLALWIWTGVPFLVITTYRICDAVEFLILYAISYALHHKSWSIRGFIASFRHSFGVIAFCLLIKNLIFPMIQKIVPESMTDSGDDVLNRILLFVSVIPIWCCFMVVRDVIYLAIRLRITSQSYKHAINDLNFMENVADRLCSSSMEEISEIRSQLHKHTHIMDRVDTIITRNMSFPLERRDNSQWIRSKTHEVTVTTEREMVIVALIIFDNFLHTTGVDLISFETWSRYFSNPAEATRGFQLFFDNECWVKQCFDETEFAKAFVRLFQRRSLMKDQLRKFENTAKLLLNVSDIPYFLLFILTLALLAGLSFSVVAVSCSALVVSFSFALGPSIERIVSSILFIFGSKPYEVNDVVQINGIIYRVHSLDLSQTTFKLESGKLCMIQHASLRTEQIINLSRSANASTTLEFNIDPKTPREKIEKLSRFVNKIVAKDSLHWRPNVRFRCTGQICINHEHETLTVSVTSTLPWRNLDAFRDAESVLRTKILDKIIRLQIE